MQNQKARVRLFFIQLSLLTLVTTLIFNNCQKNSFEATKGNSTFSSASPATGVGTNFNSQFINLKSEVAFSTSCLSESNIDACIFWKSPVDQNSGALTSIIQFGDNLNSIQTFGVSLNNLSTNTMLKSASIDVYFTAGDYLNQQRLNLTNGQRRISYLSEGTLHATSQLMVYYYLTTLEEKLTERTGTFYAKNKGLKVNAYAEVDDVGSSLLNNAFYSPFENMILLGPVGTTVGSTQVIQHEISLNADVPVHEMGHANFYHSQILPPQYDMNANYVFYNSSTDTYTAYDFNQAIPSGSKYVLTECKTNLGCIDAINEGLADFHAFILMPQNPSFIDTKYNNLTGDLRRNALANTGKAISTFYNESLINLRKSDLTIGRASKGEIHAIGSAYASILWDIYSNPQTDKIAFEKNFQYHLTKLTTSSRFSDARDILISQDQSLFGGVNSNIILSIFTAKGVP